MRHLSLSIKKKSMNKSTIFLPVLALLLGSAIQMTAQQNTEFPIPNYYYKLELKAAPSQFLRINDTGLAAAWSFNKKDEDYYQWLFVPTGVENEYWIFNKGAQNGFGQALTLPYGKKLYGQWDFLKNENVNDYELANHQNRQIFILEKEHDYPHDYYKLILKYKSNVEDSHVVACRNAGEVAFTWGNENVDNQLFRLVPSEFPANNDDMLISYLAWNIDNMRIQTHILDKMNLSPFPKQIVLNEFVYLNNTDKEISVDLHSKACGLPPWRSKPGYNQLPSCRGGLEINPGGTKSDIITPYMRNIDDINRAAGISFMWIATAAATVFTAGSAGPVLVSSTATTSAKLWAGAKVLTTLTGIGLSMNKTYSEAEAGFGNGISIDKNTPITRKIEEELGRLVFEVSGETYDKVMTDQSFYVYENKTGVGFDRMLFGSGKALFIVNDYQIEGNWRGDGVSDYVSIGDDVKLRFGSDPATLGGGEYLVYKKNVGETSRSLSTIETDPKIPNRFTNSDGEEFTIENANSLRIHNKALDKTKIYSRIFDCDGLWREVDSNNSFIWAMIASHPADIWSTVNFEVETGSFPLLGQQGSQFDTNYFKRDSNPNTYVNANTGESFTLVSRNQLRLNQKGIIRSFQKARVIISNANKYVKQELDNLVLSDSPDYFELVDALRPNPIIGFNGISIMSMNNGDKLYVTENDVDAELRRIEAKNDLEPATFYQRLALDGGGGVSFESSTNRGRYLRVMDSELVVDFHKSNESLDDFNKDISFNIFQTIDDAILSKLSINEANARRLAYNSWDSTEGDMIFTGDSSGKLANYGKDQGRILGNIIERTIDGYWVEHESSTRCDSQRDGSYYWGLFVGTFDSTFSSFDGKWSYCGEEPGADWTITRK